MNKFLKGEGSKGSDRPVGSDQWDRISGIGSVGSDQWEWDRISEIGSDHTVILYVTKGPHDVPQQSLQLYSSERRRLLQKNKFQLLGS